MMTNLDLVNALILELGINGGRQLAGIGAADNTKEALRVAGFVADADLRIQSLYNNWNFLWRQYTGQIVTGGQLSLPSYKVDSYVFRLFDRGSLVLFPGTTQAYTPRFVDWREFVRLYLSTTSSTTFVATPEAFSVSPNRRIYLSNPVSGATPYQIEGFAQAYRMKSDADVSPIVRYMSSHPMNKILASANLGDQVVMSYQSASAANERDYDGRIIICRAKMIYAEAEGAMEVMQGSMAEYEDCLKEMQSIALPGQEGDWASQDDIPQQIDPFG
jgi:hypothetical protein